MTDNPSRTFLDFVCSAERTHSGCYDEQDSCGQQMKLK